MPKPHERTKFMIDLHNRLITTNGLAKGSADLYITKLKKLNGNKVFNSFAFLKNTKDITELINTYENDNTKKSYIASIVSVLNYADMKQYKGVNMFYKSMLADAKKEIEMKPKNEKTEKQEANWMDWDEVKSVWNGLKDQVDNMKPEEIEGSLKSRKVYQAYILLSLYVKSAPRRNQDYYEMRLDADNNMMKNFNYYRPNKKQFVFNVYKTAKTYNQDTMDVNETLQAILVKYIKDFKLEDEDYLLYPDDKERKSSSVITKDLNRIFGKNVGSSMLRHSYITSQLGPKIKELKEVAESMGHSTDMQSDYVLN
jgi:integrase